MNKNLNWEEITKKAEDLALSEIEKYGSPIIVNFEISNRKGIELAERLNVNKDIVKIGTRLMDIKLGEAIAQNRLKEHVKMSSDETKKFLAQFEIVPEDIDKIINCIEGHHKDVEWRSIEAEICANADCYKFLILKNWIAYMHSLGHKGLSFEESLKKAEEKLEEKWNILSLDICKKELEPHYKIINEIILNKK